MPGRDYTRAYALLEQSLGDTYLSQPHPNQDQRIVTLGGHQISSKTLSTRKFFRQHDTIHDKLTNPTTPSRLGYKDKGLPPTPPSKTRSNESSEFTTSTLPLYNSQTGGSTPEDSAPSLRQDRNLNGNVEGMYLRKSGNPSMLSPYPESFRTALEEQGSPYIDANHSQYFSTHSLKIAPLLEPTKSFYSNEGQYASNRSIRSSGSMREDVTDVLLTGPVVTPLAHVPFQEEPRHTTPDGRTHPGPYLGLRRISPKPLHHLIDDVAEQPVRIHKHDNDESIPLLMRGLSQRRNQHTKRSSSKFPHARIVDSIPWPHATIGTPHEFDLKRYSGNSNNSTIVQAYIFDSTPPPQERKLRHSPKNSDLREKVSHREISNQSVDSYATPLQSSKRKHRHLPNQKDRKSMSSDFSVLPTSIDVVQHGQINGNSGSQNSMTVPTQVPVRQDQLFKVSRNRNSVGSDFSARSEPHALIRKDQQIPYRPEHHGNGFEHSPTSQSDEKTRNWHGDINSLPAPPNIAILQPLPSRLHVDEPSGRLEDLPNLNESELETNERHELTDCEGMMDCASSERKDLLRPNRERSRGANHHPQSWTSLHGKSSPPNSFRYHDVVSTPLSFQSEALSVHEATTVNIYPHHNESLLVVEHSPPMDPHYQKALALITVPSEYSSAYRDSVSTGFPATTHPNLPFMAIDTNAAPMAASNSHNPPVVSIIPPTPADDVNPETPFAHSQELPPAANSVQGASMLKRVRQYSDTIFQPLIAFTVTNTGSLRRSIPVRKSYRNNRRCVSASRHAELTNKDSNLHAFWQPRAFWDGISSDGSDDGEAQLRADLEGHNHLPLRSGARDVEMPQMTTIPTRQASAFTKWRLGRGGSLRGFLIGNSLGIERGPTNRRRHVVRWPTGREKRRVASEMGGCGPTTMLRDSSCTHNGIAPSFRETPSAVLRRSTHGTTLVGAKGVVQGWKRKFPGGGAKW